MELLGRHRPGSPTSLVLPARRGWSFLVLMWPSERDRQEVASLHLKYLQVTLRAGHSLG